MGCNVLLVDCLKVDTFEDNGGHTQNNYHRGR